MDSNTLKPDQLIRGKDFKTMLDFKCLNPKCGHVYKLEGLRISTDKDKQRQCNYCTISPKVDLCKYNPEDLDSNCDVCVKNSLGFKNEIFVKYWDYENNSKHPYEVRRNDGKNKYNLLCQTEGCKNKKEFIPHKKNDNVKNSFCKDCFSQSKVSNTDLKNPKEGKSVKDYIEMEKVSIDQLDKEKNKGVTFEMISRYTKKKFNFICRDCGESYEHGIPSRSLNNIWHRNCEKNNNQNSNQNDLFKYVNNICPEGDWIYEKTFDWCVNKNNNKMRYDIVSIKYKIIIEYDGEGHFHKLFGKDRITTQKNDIHKMKLAFENGYRIIRLSYSYKAEKDWKEYIKNSVDDLIKNRNTFLILCDKDMYFEDTKDEFIEIISSLCDRDESLYNYIPLPPIPNM